MIRASIALSELSLATVAINEALTNHQEALDITTVISSLPGQVRGF
jgi:hypothetical protein